MPDLTPIDRLADTVMNGLQEYADLATDDLKKSIKKAGETARDYIQENAPKKTGKYAKSWTVKTTKETANSMEVVVHSKKHYPRAHLLEFGHATRNGGRVAARPHIAPAEKEAVEQLKKDIERSLKDGRA